MSFLQLDAERGRMCAVGGAGDLVIVVVAEPQANVGLIRVELLKALESARVKIAAVEAWVEAPLQRFVDEARARLALLLHPSGQVLAQAGFARAVDVMTACALAAASHATSRELGRQVDGKPFRGLHHAGPEQADLSRAGRDAGAAPTFV